MSLSPRIKRKLLRWLVVLLFVGGFVGWFAWYKFFREEPETTFAVGNEEERFKYGSIGAEADRGLPFYVWLVLPRVFADKVPGPGGYKAFGLVWEEGHEMPVGFTKKVIGFPRVANNCAICHVGTWRTERDAELDQPPRNVKDKPQQVVVGAPSHTVDVQGVLRFLIACGDDPRFNADMLMPEIEREVKLSAVDKLLYRYLIIPATRKALRQQKEQMAWMERDHGKTPRKFPDWGRGRDDPMNLTKYFMTELPKDDTTGQADFPSIWNLKVRKGEGLFLNWSCDTPSARSVIIDSALGLGAQPGQPFLKRMDELEKFLSDLKPPEFPFPIDEPLAKKGEPIYRQHCAECHDVGAKRTNKPIPPAEIGTDQERMKTWTQAAADAANAKVKSMGITRQNMVKQDAYQSPPLDGIWMRAPYLHNGSVANLRELLEPDQNRMTSFYRGYDVYDPVNVGFRTDQPAETPYTAWKLDTTERGNGNLGHNYGTGLNRDEKDALIEYLKTL